MARHCGRMGTPYDPVFRSGMVTRSVPVADALPGTKEVGDAPFLKFADPCPARNRLPGRSPQIWTTRRNGLSPRRLYRCLKASAGGDPIGRPAPLRRPGRARVSRSVPPRPRGATRARRPNWRASRTSRSLKTNTRHWPMISALAELARLLCRQAQGRFLPAQPSKPVPVKDAWMVRVNKLRHVGGTTTDDSAPRDD